VSVLVPVLVLAAIIAMRVAYERGVREGQKLSDGYHEREGVRSGESRARLLQSLSLPSWSAAEESCRKAGLLGNLTGALETTIAVLRCQQAHGRVVEAAESVDWSAVNKDLS